MPHSRIMQPNASLLTTGSHTFTPVFLVCTFCPICRFFGSFYGHFSFLFFCILQLIILYSHSCYHHALFHYRVRCHIVHLSTAKALPIIIEARKAGAPLTVETCHHYLSLEAETIPDGATQYKCCPPIRGKSNQVSTFYQQTTDTRCRHLKLMKKCYQLPQGQRVCE